MLPRMCLKFEFFFFSSYLSPSGLNLILLAKPTPSGIPLPPRPVEKLIKEAKSFFLLTTKAKSVFVHSKGDMSLVFDFSAFSFQRTGDG